MAILQEAFVCFDVFLIIVSIAVSILPSIVEYYVVNAVSSSPAAMIFASRLAPAVD